VEGTTRMREQYLQLARPAAIEQDPGTDAIGHRPILADRGA
jgi:hypothetical protein